MKSIRIGGKLVGKKNPTFIIAELSANHNQKLDIAVKSIKAAKETGADAVKIQTYFPETMTIDADNNYFKVNKGSPWEGQKFYQLYQEAYTPWEWHPKLKKIAEDLGLLFFSTPFDKTAVDFLEKEKVPAYKIASYEITDYPLIQYISSKNKPLIISTGVAKLDEIKDVIKICEDNGNDQIILLKCTSTYPAPLKEMNLKSIPFLAKTFRKNIGLSDHSLGIVAPIVAVTLGACVIEKHFILDRKMGGPDAVFSTEPHEFKMMVDSIREVEKSLGNEEFKITKKITKNRTLSRSIFVVKNMRKGETFNEKNIRSIRPGYGLHPKHFSEIISRKAKKDIKRGTPLSWDQICKH